ncbi:uncharacterized protein LOC136020910 [Lathamus discolor]|uniref:uncharacterized protein LOC136020910 n=1 Tax=Lathamus discolor TaxID=678569 RepID=UPI0032B8548F
MRKAGGNRGAPHSSGGTERAGSHLCSETGISRTRRYRKQKLTGSAPPPVPNRRDLLNPDGNSGSAAGRHRRGLRGVFTLTAAAIRTETPSAHQPRAVQEWGGPRRRGNEVAKPELPGGQKPSWGSIGLALTLEATSHSWRWGWTRASLGSAPHLSRHVGSSLEDAAPKETSIHPGLAAETQGINTIISKKRKLPTGEANRDLPRSPGTVCH